MLLTEVASHLQAGSSIGSGYDNLAVALEHDGGNEGVRGAAETGRGATSVTKRGIQLPAASVTSQRESFGERVTISGLSGRDDIPIGLDSSREGGCNRSVREARDGATVRAEGGVDASIRVEANHGEAGGVSSGGHFAGVGSGGQDLAVALHGDGGGRGDRGCLAENPEGLVDAAVLVVSAQRTPAGCDEDFAIGLQCDGAGAKTLQGCEATATECSIQLAVTVEAREGRRREHWSLPSHDNLAIRLQGQVVAVERQVGDTGGAKCGIKTAVRIEAAPAPPEGQR